MMCGVAKKKTNSTKLLFLLYSYVEGVRAFTLEGIQPPVRDKRPVQPAQDFPGGIVDKSLLPILVRSLVWEDVICHGAMKPVSHSCGDSALESEGCKLLSPRVTTTEARVPRACALQQEKPLP